MKRLTAFVLVFAFLCPFVLAGCGEAAEKEYPLPLSPRLISQELYGALAEGWASWDALSDESQRFSSQTPGWGKREFEDWSECTAFLGFPLPNPLETEPGLEKGTYVAMPVGFLNAPRFEVSWYGTRDGVFESISVNAGYRKGEIRICLDAMLFGVSPEEDAANGSVSSTQLLRQEYLENAQGDAPYITRDSSENYVAVTAYVAQGYVLYSIRCIGEPGMDAEVNSTLEEILPLFGR